MRTEGLMSEHFSAQRKDALQQPLPFSLSLSFFVFLLQGPAFFYSIFFIGSLPFKEEWDK